MGNGGTGERENGRTRGTGRFLKEAWQELLLRDGTRISFVRVRAADCWFSLFFGVFSHSIFIQEQELWAMTDGWRVLSLPRIMTGP